MACGSDEGSPKQLFTVSNPVKLILTPIDPQGRSPRGERTGRSSSDRTTPPRHKSGEGIVWYYTHIADNMSVRWYDLM